MAARRRKLSLRAPRSDVGLVSGPVLKYPGAKWRLSDWIIAHMPPHEVYVEPFFGSGAIFFRKSPAKLETINDINGHVVNLFQVIRERPEDLAAAVALTPWAREEYDASYDRDLTALDPVEAARQFLVRTWQGYGSAADQHKNGWRMVLQRDKGPRTVPYRQWRNVPERILLAADRLKDAQIECRPAIPLLKANARPGVLVYVDPPYVLSTLSRGRNGRKVYDHQMSDEEHEELLSVLIEHPGHVLLSGYSHPMYDEALANWERVSIRAAVEKGQTREEVLWISPRAAEDLGGRLFWDGAEAKRGG